MRTLLKHGLLAASVAAVALACGSSNKNREPAAQAENSQASYDAQNAQPQPSYDQTQTTPQQQTPSGNDMTPNGSDATGSTFGAGGPQKPFYGPGTTDPDKAGTATTNDAQMNAKQTTNLSDGEIVAIVDAANNGEIQMAEVARKTATNAQVKNFAAMMIAHHRDAENKLKALAKKQNLTMKEDDTSNKLKSDVQNMISDLRSKKGRDFDGAYMDDQVKAHRDVLDIVDNQLMPSVQNTELKSALTDARKMVSEHLQKAEDIQSKMQAVGTTSTSSGTMKGKATTDTAKSKSGNTAGCDRSKDPDCDNDVHPAKSDKAKGSDKSGSDKPDTDKGKSGSQGQY